jgi:hypothetical protein
MTSLVSAEDAVTNPSPVTADQWVQFEPPNNYPLIDALHDSTSVWLRLCMLLNKQPDWHTDDDWDPYYS